MRKFFSVILAFLLTLTVLFSAFSEDAAIPPLETPPPARIHEEPEPTEVPPEIINRTKTPDPLEGFRFRLDSKMLHIWFPNISNADEALILYDEEAWLIDCASEKLAPRGTEMMQRLGVTKIDKLFCTHPHYDHIEGLQITNEYAPVGELLYSANFPADTNDTMITTLSYAAYAGIPVRTFEDGETFSMGDGAVTMTFYFNPYDYDFTGLNERAIINLQNDSSAISLLEYTDRRILFMADLDRNYGQINFYPRITAGLDLRADIIKYPHHGNNGMLSEFYDAIGATLSIITNNRGVQKSGIDFLLSKRAGIFYTNYPERYVHLYTDGHTWVIEYVPLTDFPPLE